MAAVGLEVFVVGGEGVDEVVSMEAEKIVGGEFHVQRRAA
jgi:hypothetical protein